VVILEIAVNTSIYKKLVWINTSLIPKVYKIFCLIYICSLPYPYSSYALCTRQHRFVFGALCSCLLDQIGEKRSYKQKIHLDWILYLLCSYLYLVLFISSCEFKLLFGVLSFKPEWLPLVFPVEPICSWWILWCFCLAIEVSTQLA